MIQLANTYKKNSYEFNLIERDGDVAIYEQIDPDTKQRVAFEVFEILKWPDREISGVKIAAREGTPSNEQWGKNGYTVWTIDEAIKKKELLKSKLSEREQTAKNQS
jgi:hypothetical protein